MNDISHYSSMHSLDKQVDHLKEDQSKVKTRFYLSIRLTTARAQLGQLVLIALLQNHPRGIVKKTCREMVSRSI